MDILEQQLYDFMIEKDVPASIAKAAAVECARRVERNALLGATAGLFAGYCTGNPAAILMGVAGAGFAGTATLIASPSCQQVRDAASRILFDTVPQ